MTRLRDLGITIGEFPTGPFNAITDVKDVLVGHTTIILEEPRIARTGVTIIMPRRGDVWRNPAFAAYHSFNGCGEMTGLLWVEESGQLSHPIALTSTHHVGTVHEALVAYAQEHGHTEHSSLPVVAETWDGWLNDMDGFHLKARHVYAALGGLAGGPVAEGNVGGGTGMICHEFKGGIGTSSRVVETKSGAYTVGALVQANHGSREDFRVGGVPVGRLIDPSETPVPWPEPAESSSIIIVVATDAPLRAPAPVRAVTPSSTLAPPVLAPPVVAPPEGAQAAAPVHFDDQAEGPAAGEPIVGSIGLDLGRVLNLPTEGLSYSVFLWIDELTSAPKGVHVDRSDARKGLMPMPVSGAVALSARPDASVAANEQPAVSLRTTAGSWKLEGELIPDKTHPLDPLLVLVEAPRRGGALAYGSTPLGKIDAPVYSFYFDPRNLFTPAQITEGPLFAFAMYGHVRTAVVRVDAPQPGGDGETHAAGDAAPPAPASSSP